MEKVRYAEALHIGTELLTLRLNTHTTALAQKLLPLGFRLRQAVLLADRLNDMTEAIKESLNRSPLVIVTGGLGPTFDDISREAASAATGRPLKEDPALINELKAKFRLARINMPQVNHRQALLLEGAISLSNKAGTAPGQFLDLGDKILLLLPGPPRELERTWESAWPILVKKFGLKPMLIKSFQIAGLAESKVQEMATALLTSLPQDKVESTILASSFIIDLVFQISDEHPDSMIENIRQNLESLFGHRYLGEDNTTIERELGRMLLESKSSLAAAESCTGGEIAHRLTNEPGSSNYFLESVVCYSNESKINRLDISKELIDRYGAVSEEAAKAMALGLRRQSKAQWNISVTGICGPSGGSAEKPVGLAWFGLAKPDGEILAEKKIFTGDRKLLKEKMSLYAMDWVRRELLAPAIKPSKSLSK